MDKLESCPHCGGEAEFFETGKAVGFVDCRRCNVSFEKNKEEAIRVWNHRVYNIAFRKTDQILTDNDMKDFVIRKKNLLNSNPTTLEERAKAFEAGAAMLAIAFSVNLGIHDGKFAYIDHETGRAITRSGPITVED